MRSYAMLVVAAGLAGCTEPAAPTPAGAEFPEFAHRPPSGEGMVVAEPDKVSGATPAIAVGDRWTPANRTAMTELVRTAATILTSARFRAHGTALASDYPRSWFSSALGWGDAAQVTAMAGAPSAPIRYLAATVVPSRGWASTGGREGRVLVSISPQLLARWRSRDPVMRACAVNTMAHEITHTLSRSATVYRFAFTDTGVGREARRRPPASYLAGNIALCDYLLSQRRIAADGFEACTAVWYRPGGFQGGRCDDFADGRPVR